VKKAARVSTSGRGNPTKGAIRGPTAQAQPAFRAPLPAGFYPTQSQHRKYEMTAKIVNLHEPQHPVLQRADALEREMKEFPELQLVRELTITLNTHARESICVENFRATLKRILATKEGA
jgi:hypothetical protein